MKNNVERHFHQCINSRRAFGAFFSPQKEGKRREQLEQNCLNIMDNPRKLTQIDKKNKLIYNTPALNQHKVKQQQQQPILLASKSKQQSEREEKTGVLFSLTISNKNINAKNKKNIGIQLFDLECLTSQSITESIFVEFLHEIMKQQTSLSVIDFRSLQKQKCSKFRT